jgi:hypothetical protein
MKHKFLVILGLLVCVEGLAQGPPVTLTAPGTLGFQGKAIRTFGVFNSTEDANIYTQVLAVPYNISTNLQFGAILRYTFVNPDAASASSGFNNASLFMKHQLYVKNDTGKTFRISGLLRQTFPIGPESVGSNTYQTYVGFIAGDISIKRGFYTNLGYNIVSDGNADNFLYDFSFGLPVLPHQYPLKQLNTFIEINGNVFLGEQDHLLFLSPGLQFIKGIVLIETSFQIPVIQDIENGIDTKFRILFGTRILI